MTSYFFHWIKFHNLCSNDDSVDGGYGKFV